jgi:hypothetical protein
VARRLAAIGLAVLLGATGAGVAIAQFDDVRDVTPRDVQDSIGAVAGARCSNGFPDGTFRPDDNVTRAQGAAFIQRCAARVAYNAVTTAVAAGPGATTSIGNVSLALGGRSGGTQFARVHVDVVISGAAAAAVRIIDNQGQDVTCARFATVARGTSGSCTAVFREPSGETRVFTAQVLPDQAVTVTATLDAVSIPFGSSGGMNP